MVLAWGGEDSRKTVEKRERGRRRGSSYRENAIEKVARERAVRGGPAAVRGRCRDL